MLNLLPDDILFYLFFNYFSIIDLNKCKLINKKVYYIIRYILKNNRWNTNFLKIQLELTKTIRNQVILPSHNRDITLINRWKDLERLVRVMERGLRGKPEGIIGTLDVLSSSTAPSGHVWVIESIDLFVEKHSPPRICASKQNTHEQLLCIDDKLRSMEWIKLFPSKSEAERGGCAFIYANPKHISDENWRKPFHNCPICKDPTHSMFTCRNSYCYVCRQHGHLTRICKNAFCSKCRNYGHASNACR
jgi:hypothetical protein